MFHTLFTSVLVGTVPSGLSPRSCFYFLCVEQLGHSCFGWSYYALHGRISVLPCGFYCACTSNYSRGSRREVTYWLRCYLLWNCQYTSQRCVQLGTKMYHSGVGYARRDHILSWMIIRPSLHRWARGYNLEGASPSNRFTQFEVSHVRGRDGSLLRSRPIILCVEYVGVYSTRLFRNPHHDDPP